MKNIYNESELVFEEKSKNWRFQDLEGQIFGRLTVLGFVGNRLWHCKCECGNITKVHSGEFKSGSTKSCGCFQKNGLKKETQRMAKAKGVSQLELITVGQAC